MRRMRLTHGPGCAGRPQRSRMRSVAESNGSIRRRTLHQEETYERVQAENPRPRSSRYKKCVGGEQAKFELVQELGV